MKTWFDAIRRSLGLALSWAVVWAPLGVLLGVIVDSTGAMDEPWAAVGAYPGFLCGLFVAVGLGLTGGRRRLATVSLGRAAAWGAVSGLLVVGLSSVVGTPNTNHPLDQWRIIIIGGAMLLSALSAVGSVVVARQRHARDTGHVPIA